MTGRAVELQGRPEGGAGTGQISDQGSRAPEFGQGVGFAVAVAGRAVDLQGQAEGVHGTGFLEWEVAPAPTMTSTQWSEANTTLASDCVSSSPPPAQGAPTVVTSSASGVTSTTATLNGTVNPEGADASWQFDGGTSTAYGNVAPSPAGDAGSGTSPVSESTTITGLSPSTTYHFRIEATNSAGTS